jgi:hypothetical protein
VFLLLLPLKMQAQHGRIQHLRKLRPFVDLLPRWDLAVLMIQGCRDFGFEEFLLLLLLRHSVGASPAFPGTCSRKPIFKISLYHIMLNVKERFLHTNMV